MTSAIKQRVASRFWLINAVFFQIAWFVAVIGQQSGILWQVLLLALHFLISPTPARDRQTLYWLAPAGIALDSLLRFFGVFVFSAESWNLPGLIPFWLVLLWCHFVLALNHSLHWLKQWPWWAVALAGGISGPLSYFAGYRLEAVQWPLGPILSTAILVCCWAMLLPLFIAKK